MSRQSLMNELVQPFMNELVDSERRRSDAEVALVVDKLSLLAQLKLCAALLSEMHANHYGKTTEPWLTKFSAQIKAADAVIRKAEGGQ